jgi:hypothetical protein
MAVVLPPVAGEQQPVPPASGCVTSAPTAATPSQDRGPKSPSFASAAGLSVIRSLSPAVSAVFNTDQLDEGPRCPMTTVTIGHPRTGVTDHVADLLLRVHDGILPPGKELPAPNLTNMTPRNCR